MIRYPLVMVGGYIHLGTCHPAAEGLYVLHLHLGLKMPTVNYSSLWIALCDALNGYHAIAGL